MNLVGEVSFKPAETLCKQEKDSYNSVEFQLSLFKIRINVKDEFFKPSLASGWILKLIFTFVKSVCGRAFEKAAIVGSDVMALFKNDAEK